MIKKAVFCDICGEPYRTLPKEQNSTFAEHLLFSKKMGDACPIEMRYKAGALVDICPVCRNTVQAILNRLGSAKR